MTILERWYCRKCKIGQEIDMTRTALYLTKEVSGFYPLIFWICEGCKKELQLNEHTLTGNIVLIEDDHIVKEIPLLKVPDDQCSICHGSYDPYEDYGICLHDEKYSVKEKTIDNIDAVHIFNICTKCYKDINLFLNKVSGIEDHFFGVINTGLEKQRISGNKLEASHAFGKIEDDGETMQIVDNLHRIDFQFVLR